MPPFHIELLPDDVLRLLFDHWLNWYTPKHICNLDSALCNSSVRGWFLDFVRCRGIPLRCNEGNFRFRENRYDGVVRWLLTRRFPLDSIDVALDTATLRFLHCEADKFSVLGSVRNITISSCRMHDAAVAPNLLRALLAEASSMTSLTLQLGMFYDFTDSIPWDIILGNRELIKLNVWLGKDSGPLLYFPRVIQQRPNIKDLKFNHAQFEWSEFDALLSSCPNLNCLTLWYVGFRSVPSRDVMIAARAPALPHVKNISVPNNDIVAEYLLRRCPNVESVDLMGVTFEWLPWMLQSSSVRCLRSLRVSTAFDEDLDPSDTLAIQAQSNEPFQFTVLCGDGSPTIQILRLLQSAQLMKFSLSLSNLSGRYCQRHLNVAEFESIPLTRICVGFEGEFGNAEEWMFILQLPRLQQLDVGDDTEPDLNTDDIVPDVGDVFAECVQRHNERGISPSPVLRELSCRHMSLYTAVNHLVHLLPHLSMLELWRCRLNTESVATLMLGLPLLSRLDVQFSRGHPIVEYDFRGVDFAGRPRMVVTTDNDLLPTWSVSKSFVVGLGSHLGQIDVEETFADLSAHPDEEFLAQNEHVSVFQHSQWRPRVPKKK